MFKPLVPNAVGDQIPQFVDDLTVEDNNNFEKAAENSRANTADASKTLESKSLGQELIYLAETTEINWRDESYRNNVCNILIAPTKLRFDSTESIGLFLSENLQARCQIINQLNDIVNEIGVTNGNEMGTKWENEVFKRSETCDEYDKLVRKLLSKLRSYHSKKKSKRKFIYTDDQQNSQDLAMTNGSSESVASPKILNNNRLHSILEFPKFN